MFYSEAVETRHALHGVRWPASNPKCLNVDFGTIVAMGKAIASTSEDVQKEVVREERVSGGWDRFEQEERRVISVEFNYLCALGVTLVFVLM